MHPSTRECMRRAGLRGFYLADVSASGADGIASAEDKARGGRVCRARRAVARTRGRAQGRRARFRRRGSIPMSRTHALRRAGRGRTHARVSPDEFRETNGREGSARAGGRRAWGRRETHMQRSRDVRRQGSAARKHIALADEGHAQQADGAVPSLGVEGHRTGDIMHAQNLFDTSRLAPTIYYLSILRQRSSSLGKK
ncbi:hypothetical protein FB451DRAFT_1171517 [Mycena latifolia]|nr:hypothetical protein FB451DRAFT_1171517 [Mycena latifolia]